ncbi:MAG: hypothetical protein E6R04_01560 [Spirochaetes bacterium]|nr:MAG: hypothetical protein E6R04_01560 [Spirochaetota bacterium]
MKKPPHTSRISSTVESSLLRGRVEVSLGNQGVTHLAHNQLVIGMNESQKRYWLKNKAYYESKRQEYRAKIRQEIRKYKESHPCIRCGESHPACLAFHHIDPKTKESEIANAVVRGWGWVRVLEEIEKCVILCANCHAKEHDSSKESS